MVSYYTRHKPPAEYWWAEGCVENQVGKSPQAVVRTISCCSKEGGDSCGSPVIFELLSAGEPLVWGPCRELDTLLEFTRNERVLWEETL